MNAHAYNGRSHTRHQDMRVSNAINYKNNPLNGVGLKQLLNELVDHYGFEILFAYLNINCFKNKPSIESSAKFLKKTDWAREKVESFYLYKFKNLPRASSEQFSLPPRVRIIPDDQKPGEPAELSLEDAERLRQHRAKKAAERDQGAGGRMDTGRRYGAQRDKPAANHTAKPDRDSSDARGSSVTGDNDPWGNWKS